jgi:hypothetical protein
MGGCGRVGCSAQGTSPARRIKPGMRVANPVAPIHRRRNPTEPEKTPVAEDRKEPPFEGGSQPVPHQKDPVPGPGRTAGQVATLVIAVLLIAAIAVYIFGR